jgi:hypothetical protein
MTSQLNGSEKAIKDQIIVSVSHHLLQKIYVYTRQQGQLASLQLVRSLPFWMVRMARAKVTQVFTRHQSTAVSLPPSSLSHPIRPKRHANDAHDIKDAPVAI